MVTKAHYMPSIVCLIEALHVGKGQVVEPCSYPCSCRREGERKGGEEGRRGRERRGGSQEFSHAVSQVHQQDDLDNDEDDRCNHGQDNRDWWMEGGGGGGGGGGREGGREKWGRIY